jgi:hypothetical protein
MSGRNPEDGDQEFGEPIGELKEIALDTPVSLLPAVRRKVHRRTTASQLLTFGLQAPKMIAIEAVRMMIEILSTLGKRRGG